MFKDATPKAMVYESMAVRYRPLVLDDLIGQDTSVAKVRGFLNQGKVPRSLLISGPFGSGKTTLARMIARYLNCQSHGPKSCCAEEGSPPCFACSQMGTRPTLSDYQELNVANDRGIDAVRNLVEMSYMNPKTRFRVFCLDEAHQFTSQASQVLLKPMEEPPANTVWIICTTAPEKILATIRSRCFKIHVDTVSADDCRPWIKSIAAKEGVPEFPEAVWDNIINSAQGHPRTALNALEGVVAFVSARGTDELESSIDKLLKDVVKTIPENSARKWVTSMLNGSFNAFAHCDKIDNPDRFLALSMDYVQSIILNMACRPINAYHSQYIQKTKWKKKMGLADAIDGFVRIQNIMNQSHADSKSYIMDGQQLINSTTLAVLAITRKWENLPK